MDETNPWAGLTSIQGANSDQTFLNSMQSAGSIDPSMLMTAPLIGGQAADPSQTADNTYGGAVSAGSNGYPVFSTPSTYSPNSPGGLVGTNPIDATPNVIASQARVAPTQSRPSASPPQQANYNPWAIQQSSGNDAFSYPMGNNPPPPKINIT